MHVIVGQTTRDAKLQQRKQGSRTRDASSLPILSLSRSAPHHEWVEVQVRNVRRSQAIKLELGPGRGLPGFRAFMLLRDDSGPRSPGQRST